MRQHIMPIYTLPKRVSYTTTRLDDADVTLVRGLGTELETIRFESIRVYENRLQETESEGGAMAEICIQLIDRTRTI